MDDMDSMKHSSIEEAMNVCQKQGKKLKLGFMKKESGFDVDFDCTDKSD